MKSDDRVTVEETTDTVQPDRARDRSSGRNPSVRLARTGAEIAGGATSLGSAMVAAGYSEWTARVPSANGVTVGRALQAAAEVFPSARKTLKALRPKALAVLDRGLTLDKDERPDQTHLQASALALKLGAEIGDEEQDTVTDADRHNGRRHTRLLARRFARGALRRAEQIGIEAALKELVSFEAAERERWPRLAEIEASQPLEGRKRWDR